MGISIVTNVASLSAQRNLGRAQEMQQSSVGRLSSGLRINRAADDAAGLGISESLRADIRSLSQAKRNASDGISMTQVAEGAMNEIQGIVGRMRELAVQSANGTLGTTERGYIQTEFNALRSEINRITEVTEFNGRKLINGSTAAGVAFQVGIQNTTNDRLTLSIAALSAGALGSTGSVATGAATNVVGSQSLSTASKAQSAIAVFDSAIKQLSTARAGIGAMQNRLSVTLNNLSVSHENLTAAESRIRDVDVAEETSALTRSQILSQASISLLSQANQLPGSALALLG